MQRSNGGDQEPVSNMTERSDASQKPTKDSWDKVSIVSQIFSSLVLATVGGLITFYFQYNSKNTAIVSDFLGKVVSANAGQREQYLNALDLELGARYSIPLAIRLSTPIQLRNAICGGKILSDPIATQEQEEEFADVRTTRELLQRLSLTSSGRKELQEISKSGVKPDADIADAYLGKGSKVYYRVTEIDDYATIEIDANKHADQNFPQYKFGDEPPWVDISDRMTKGTVNTFFLTVSNKVGSSGARLQMRIGADQYDQYVGTKNNEPAGRMFFFSINITVDDRGNTRLSGDNVVPLEGILKDEKCD
jgi:hypothetical protein